MFEPKGWGYLQNYEHMVQPIIAKVDTAQGSKEYPLHTHPKGQLILALDGYVTCEAANKMWMVPTHSAIWVPANTCHSNRASDNANLCFVFIDANLKGMPTHTCTLAITSLVKSLMLKLASENQAYSEGDKTARLAQVLFDLLIEMPAQPLDFALSKHVVIQTMSRELIEHPNNQYPFFPNRCENSSLHPIAQPLKPYTGSLSCTTGR